MAIKQKRDAGPMNIIPKTQAINQTYNADKTRYATDLHNRQLKIQKHAASVKIRNTVRRNEEKEEKRIEISEKTLVSIVTSFSFLKSLKFFQSCF